MAEAIKPEKSQRMTPTQARAARRARRKARRGLMRYLGFGAVGVVAIVFLVALFLPGLPFGTGSSGGQVVNGPGERIPDQGTAHIIPGDDHPPYNSVPATSGWHYFSGSTVSPDSTYTGPAPARWGIYNEFIPDEVLVHNLEHGGVRIHYNCPEECPELVANLSQFARRYTEVIVSPDPRIDSLIALAAWTFLMKLDAYDEEAITDFVSSHMNSANAPEYLAP